jgi:hypothetical protein
MIECIEAGDVQFEEFGKEEGCLGIGNFKGCETEDNNG